MSSYLSGIVLNIFMNSLIFKILHSKSDTNISFVLQKRTMSNKNTFSNVIYVASVNQWQDLNL